MKEQLKLAQKLKKLGVMEFKTGDFFVSFFKEKPKEEPVALPISKEDLKKQDDLPNYVKDIMGENYGD